MMRLLQQNHWFFTRCMILHPVTFPNKGPILQQYLAEQAVGLASSLGWQVVKGPFWNSINKNLLVPTSVYEKQTDFFLNDNTEQANQIMDGQYVDTLVGRGIKHQDGVIFDAYQSQSDGDLHREWRDKLKRESIANSSLIKAKRITQKTYFTKGKLDPIAAHIKQHSIDCVFVNKQLKPTQVRNLTKILEAKVNNVAEIYQNPSSGQIGESQTEYASQDVEAFLKKKGKSVYRKVKVFDRFSIILQIFAQRTTTKLSKLQIQLSFLNYLRTRLVRDGSTYSSNLNMFSGDLMKTRQVNLQVISAKQRRAFQTMSGEGQSQLQIERRNIRDKQAKIRNEIKQQTRLRGIKTSKSQKVASRLPVVALVGYTNVGKSAFMNAILKKKQTESKDMLFQTLSTTSRYVYLMSGRQINLLDTIGFITDLPVQLVESFKSTLEEVSHADLVIHLRDISSPQHDLQKKSVIKILQELEFKENFSSTNMIQVWNKVDLITKEERKDKLESQACQIMISCTTGEGIQELMELVDQKLRELSGAQQRILQYSLSKHYKVVNWLKQNTNLPYKLNETFDYQSSQQYPQGRVRIQLEIDSATFGKIKKFIQGENFSRNSRNKKGMPPKEGW